MTKKIVALILSILFIMATNVHAKMARGVNFADTYVDEETLMTLMGVGRKKVFFKDIFYSGFYLQEGVNREDALDNVAKRIEVQYERPIPAEKVYSYVKRSMKKSMKEEEYQLVVDDVLRMRQYFVDLEPGDRFNFTYVPGVGTKFDFNDEYLGVVEGNLFGKGIFATWVGDKPFDMTVRNQVLGYESFR